MAAFIHRIGILEGGGEFEISMSVVKSYSVMIDTSVRMSVVKSYSVMIDTSVRMSVVKSYTIMRETP